MVTHAQKVRALAVAIANAESVLGLASGQGAPLTWRVERIIQAVQSGELDRRTYRAVWLVRSRLLALCEP
jgi:hypothetical protein